MKWIRQRLDKIKEPFSKGNKYEKFAPAINALDTFLFVPNHTTKKGAHVRDAVDLKRVMITVVLALVPALIFGMWNTGYQYLHQIQGEVGFWEAIGYGATKFLPMIVVSYAVGLGIEFAFAIMRGHEVNEGYLVTGLLIPMIMPIGIPLWMVAVSVVFAVVIGKEAFGGTGMNILNPALTARAFAFFAYPTYMSGNTVWVSEAGVIDGVSGETILGKLAAGTDVPYTSMDMFSGLIPGSISETSTICILAGALLLILTKVGSWRIIFSGFIGAACMALIFNWLGGAYFPDNDLMNFPWYNHLIVGGLAFGVVFMATDPVSAAQTFKGKWIYGFLIGLFAVMIRVFNPAYPEGIMLAILLMNVFAPTIDHFVIESNVKKRKKRVKAQVKTA
ncbi:MULTISPECIES: NADH:ubiquinone reductase (Na(+)-transporting) subunit B [Mesonia]|uniref:Na(+)-translocating NADH-quinone reductase subunit B n=1 Tax=Mesonia oceanica TaxID=2687242 RepID=A0AC61Y9W9_9FLAO|nr:MULTISPECIES: NADH:ubiquinone reductase (Na(+)-transporting) subunit B [Mesonia]MAN27853.1 NADH:ubiquinone reductase (Na(+)-transporting) subunit B [Mesonia sp.]MAQ41032.1 NADH:ubiquinone reductase (Na(+)-transporting) subunit B [Mesonia sp.]MBJ96427.1 NADH:ubiquinone reductase (Na(+)-transporting) subunit B [Flavobacteriaceae bacterium]VVV01125.1 Na(+)-translocating NADH-quinone reductase subunit B [Mesonia oceanica]|tara:strand:- start:43098 stop:44267 length:1170 start_codon:yes stop_codon:yes gene_type:complete